MHTFYIYILCAALPPSCKSCDLCMCVLSHVLVSLFFFYRCANGYIGQRCEYKDVEGSYVGELRT